jgi:predicted metal-dependent phosphoesterase TrpH
MMGSIIFKKPPLKKLRKEGLFGVDMHFHTNYSLDAVSKIPNAIRKAEKKGFGFAITDHNTIDGVMAAYKLGRAAVIIPGIEVTCNNGNHVLVYCNTKDELEGLFNRHIRPKMKTPFSADISVIELIDAAADYDAVVAAAHPYSPGVTGMMRTGVTKKIERKLDIIEAMNGFNTRKSNIKAVYWSSKIDKPTSGGSDAHSTLALGKVMTFTKGHDAESVLHEVCKGNSVIVGKEDNFFMKAVRAVRKESAYINRSEKQHLGRTLLKLQFGNEYRYLLEKFKNGAAYKMFTQRHGKEDSERLLDDE